VKSGIFYPGVIGVNDQLQSGHEDGELWIPSEVNTSIHPGWFYHQKEDDQVKSLSRLVDNWYHSEGMNSNFIINLPTDRRGLIHENDIKKLEELRQYLDKAFAVDLTKLFDKSITYKRKSI
jgi:alpha-L-fucosidase